MILYNAVYKQKTVSSYMVYFGREAKVGDRRQWCRMFQHLASRIG